MEELASLLLQSRTQAHSFHLGVKGIGSHSAHLALGEYYDAISGLIDGLVETYQGKEGLIQLSGIGTLDKNNDIVHVHSHMPASFYPQQSSAVGIEIDNNQAFIFLFMFFLKGIN